MSKMQRKPPRPPMQLTCDACGKTFVRAQGKIQFLQRGVRMDGT